MHEEGIYRSTEYWLCKQVNYVQHVHVVQVSRYLLVLVILVHVKCLL